MRLFIDPADIEQWKRFARTGLLYGATTNPLVFEREGVDAAQAAKIALVGEARDLGFHELQFQITGLSDPTAAVAEFMAVFETWPEGVVAKVPFCEQTWEITRRLDSAVPLTFTTGFAATQAVIAKSLKARYLAPYYGRLLEHRQNADKIVDDMRAICQPETRILLASLRSAAQVANLAARGHDTFTLSPTVFDDLLTDETSAAATAAFEEAARRLSDRMSS